MITIEINKKINDNDKITINENLVNNIKNMIKIINFIKSNDMLDNFRFNYRQHYMVRKNNTYIFEISFSFKDNCTLKYCKDYDYTLCQYIGQFFDNITSDYESTIDQPILNVLIKGH